MSLQLALNNALTGLKVNQRVLSVISNNIANANTEGYSRQTADLSSLTYDGIGQGVKVEDVVRKVDSYLQRAVTDQTSSVGRSSTLSEYYQRTQTLLGEPGSTNSIDEHISTFFTALQTMADSPERTSTRAAAVDAGVSLSNEFSQLYDGLQELRFQADQDIGHAITDINTQLKKLGSLNDAISNSKALGSSTAALMDQRDLAVKAIATYMNVSVHERADGEIQLYSGSGAVLLDDKVHQLEYRKFNSVEDLKNGTPSSPISIYAIDKSGARVGDSVKLYSDSSEIVDGAGKLQDGSLLGLLQVRDALLPQMVGQLDELASQMRDNFNAVHNQGSGYPAASSLTGTREIRASERNLWDGTVRIAALNDNGTPLQQTYALQQQSLQPLVLDFSQLKSGQGYGEVSTQTVIDEINQHFGIPQTKVSLGNFGNVSLTSNSTAIDPINNKFHFDFDIENLSGKTGQFWVEGVTVLDDTGANISNVTDTAPAQALSPLSTFTTTAGSGIVTVATAGVPAVKVGDYVRMADPGAPVNGISGGAFDGYFKVLAINGNTFDIDLNSNPLAAASATASGPVSLAGQTMNPAYATAQSGGSERTRQNGEYVADLTGNTASHYFDIQTTMVNVLPDGTVSRSTVSYRVPNNTPNIADHRYAPRSADRDGTVLYPQGSQSSLKAVMVDEKGNELPLINGSYGDQTGFLKIVSTRPGVTFAIDSGDSAQLGLPNDRPAKPASNRAFSHFYELNNFFHSNQPTLTGDTQVDSARYMQVEQRLLDTPNLVSTGQLHLSSQPADPGKPPVYTVERYSGDHDLAQKMVDLGNQAIHFNAAGGVPASDQSFISHAAEMLGYMSSQSSTSQANLKDNQTLLDGFTTRASAVSGVNMDEELANTIIYQNAYAASARVITVTKQLFDTLLQMGSN